MVNSNKPVFFVDLDETLIHSQRYQKDHVVGKKMKFFFLSGYQTFDAILHPQAHELLSYLRSLTPHVFMLTIAVKNYALAANKIHKLGFKPSQIFSREKIYNKDFKGLQPKMDAADKYVLIDNLPFIDNRAKLEFLYFASGMSENFMKKRHYLMVNNFYGYEPKDPVAWELRFVKQGVEDILNKLS